MIDEAADAFVWVINNVEEAIKLLPQEEQDRYYECQQSVIDARRAGERIAHEIFIS